MTVLLQLIGFLASLLAAVFWFVSAIGKLPETGSEPWKGTGPFHAALVRQSRWNAAGAISAAVAVLAQALVLYSPSLVQAGASVDGAMTRLASEWKGDPIGEMSRASKLVSVTYKPGFGRVDPSLQFENILIGVTVENFPPSAAKDLLALYQRFATVAYCTSPKFGLARQYGVSAYFHFNYGRNKYLGLVVGHPSQCLRPPQ